MAAAEKEAHEGRCTQAAGSRCRVSSGRKVNDEIKSTNDTAARKWSAVKAKVVTDLDDLKANIAQAKHDFGAKRAENYAEELEWEAGVAIDYTITSIQQAKYAFLDAVAGRVEAEQEKRA
jgi:hypothetical protein